MRFSLTTRIALTLGAVAAVGIVAIVLAGGALRGAETAANDLAAISGPLHDAAYEMEINVVGTGLGVLKYVQTGSDDARVRVDNDEADFRTFKARYDALAETQRERDLGRRIGEGYDQFIALGRELMALRDERLARLTTELDLSARIARSLETAARRTGDVVAPSLEADLGEAAAMLAAFVYSGEPDIRRRYERALEDLARTQRSAATREGLLSERDLGELAAFEEAASDLVAATVRSREVESSFVELRSRLETFLDEDIQQISAARSDAARETSRTATGGLVQLSAAILGLVGLAVVAEFMVVRAFKSGLGTLAFGLERMRRGDRAYRLPQLAREFEGIRRDFNEMAGVLERSLVERALLADSEASLRIANEDLRSEIEGRARAEASLRERDDSIARTSRLQAVGQLAGGIAHDFNNILTAVAGHAEILLLGLAPTDERRGSVEQIRAATERAAALTRQLLAFSRREPTNPTAVDLNAVITSLRPMLDRLLGEMVTVTTTLEASLPSARADPAKVDQLIVNLVVNARDAMPKGGQITVRTAIRRIGNKAGHRLGMRAGRYVALEVIDQGTGIPAGVLDRIFDPYFTTKRSGKGTGLGLATVYGIVKQSGGAIDVRTALGRGSTFVVYLPIDSTGANPYTGTTPGQTSAAHSREPKAQRILVVDDQSDVRSVVAGLLRRHGYQVLEATGPGDAVELIEAGRAVDLVLSDVVMPGMTGYALVDRIRLVQPDMRAVFMSGNVNDVAAGRRPVGARILPKPFTTEAVLEEIRLAFDHDGQNGER